MERKDSSANFRARITIEEGDTQEVEIWDDELSPFKLDCCSIREWVKMHFDNYDNKALRELLGIGEEGNWEVLIEGTIKGSWSGYDEPEYDEEIEIRDIKQQEIPAKWYEDLEIDNG